MPDMHILPLLLLLIASLAPTAARAQAPVRSLPVQLFFEGRVAGLRSFTLDALVDLTERGYRLETAYRTAGLIGAVFSADLHTRVTGGFDGTRAQPQRFLTWGHWSGKPRQTLIDYPEGEPTILTLVPPNDGEREDVPAAMQTGTIDSLSAVAALARHVAVTGRCDGQLRVFDGRRLSEITSTTIGEEMLERDRGSLFAGRALRCDFSGRQLAGFWLSDDREKAQRPQNGTAWLARMAPDQPPLPVRIRMEARWVGSATMYLTDMVSPPSVNAGAAGPAAAPPAPARR